MKEIGITVIGMDTVDVSIQKKNTMRVSSLMAIWRAAEQCIMKTAHRGLAFGKKTLSG